jgi:hypothetical protein
MVIVEIMLVIALAMLGTYLVFFYFLQIPDEVDDFLKNQYLGADDLEVERLNVARKKLKILCFVGTLSFGAIYCYCFFHFLVFLISLQ